jgi:hypothetical protein
MCKHISPPILLLISLALLALNFGCGGGAEVTSNAAPAPTPDVSTAKRMQPPVLGFVYAAGGSEVRVINGIPGASTLSSPLTLPEGVTGVDFAPSQKCALVEQTNGSSVGLITFSGANPGPLTQIAGGISKPDVVSFSPQGAAAALYSASEGRLQVLAGLPDRPQVARELTNGDLPEAVHLLAIADDGVTLLEGTVNNAVYLLAGSGAQLLESVADLGGIAFTPQSNDALVFDRSSGTLSLMQGVSSTRSQRLLASGLTGLTGNIELEADGVRAIITSSATSQLWEIDLQSLAVQNLQLPATPAMLEPLRVSGHYLLSWQPGQPAWILNTNQEKGAVYFVPAAVQAQAALAQ